MNQSNDALKESLILKKCREQPTRCKKFLAFALIRLLATTPLSRNLPWYVSFTSPSDPGPYKDPKVSPPPTPRWHSIFDNTFWEAYPGRGEWNESEQRWDATGAHIWLTPLGTWTQGWRPTWVRVEHTGGDYTTFAVENVAEEYLTIEANYVSMTEEPLVYPSPDPADDIYWLYIIGDYPVMTKIEFFGIR